MLNLLNKDQQKINANQKLDNNDLPKLSSSIEKKINRTLIKKIGIDDSKYVDNNEEKLSE